MAQRGVEIALLFQDLGITPRPHFTPGEILGTHCTGGWVGPRADLDGRKISPLPGFDPRTVQPVAQSLYWLSYAAHAFENKQLLFSKTALTIKFRVGTACIGRVNTRIRSDGLANKE